MKNGPERVMIEQRQQETRWRVLGGRARGSVGNRGGSLIGRNGVGKVLWKDISLITLIIQDSVHLSKYVTGVHFLMMTNGFSFLIVQ